MLGLFAEVCAEAAHFMFFVSVVTSDHLLVPVCPRDGDQLQFRVAELYLLLLELLGLSCAVDPAPLGDTSPVLVALGSRELGHVAGWVPNNVRS